ncbi:AraC family transcriptional regulator [Mangrovihabitans endophyticus]|nr:AraC family transcriptional regulator [Mangrovihabitans endophyticus]
MHGSPGPAAPGAGRQVLHTTDPGQAQEFCRSLCLRPVRIRPLGDAADFAFRGDVVRLGGVTVTRIACDADACVWVGEVGAAYHVLVPLHGTMLSRHGGTEVTAGPHRAAVHRPVGDVEVRLAGQCRLFSVRLDRPVLEHEMTMTFGRQLASPLPLGASFDLTAGPGRTWAALVRLLHADLAGAGDPATAPMARRWRALVLRGLALTVPFPSADPSAPVRELRPRPVKRTMDAMHAAPAHPFTAAELAGIAGVGVRVLQESFRRHVGMPPLAYLRRLRLDGVHGELTRSEPWQASVSEVACRWGFTHLGRFAGAYRERYGVSPSHTLHDH